MFGKVLYSAGALGTGLCCTSVFVDGWKNGDRLNPERSFKEKSKEILIAVPVILTASAVWPLTLVLFSGP